MEEKARDIVERLRKYRGGSTEFREIMDIAADEIERLRQPKPLAGNVVDHVAKVIYAKFEGCDMARAEEVWRQAVEGDDYIRATRQEEIEEMRDTARAALEAASIQGEELSEEQVRDLIRQRCNGNAAKWAQTNKISPAYVSDVLNGRRAPGQKILDALNIE